MFFMLCLPSVPLAADASNLNSPLSSGPCRGTGEAELLSLQAKTICEGAWNCKNFWCSSGRGGVLNAVAPLAASWFFRAAVTLLVEDDRGHDFLQLLRAKCSSRHLNRQGEYQFEASETSIKSAYPASDAHRTSCQTALVVVRFCPNERCGSFKVSAD